MSRLTTLLFSLLLASSSFASLSLPEPDEILRQASSGRMSLRNVIMDMDLNIPEMRDPATFDKYFYLLDKLHEYSTATSLDTYYPQALSSLAHHMADNGMRWLDITKDSPERIQYYVKWMSNDIVERFLGQVAYQLEDLKDLERLKIAAKNIAALLPQVEKISGVDSYGLIGFRRLISTTAVNILKNPHLPLSEKLFWINQVQIPSEFAAYLDTLINKVYGINRVNREDGLQYLELLLAINERSRNLPTSASASHINTVQDAIVETLIRLVTFEEPLTDEEFITVLDAFNPRQIQSLSQLWMALRYNPSSEYTYTYLHLSGKLIDRASELSLYKDASQLFKWLSQSSTPSVLRIHDMEGMYQLVDQAGEKWTLTLAIAREDMVVGALSRADRALERALYNVTLDYESMNLIASDRPTDVDHEANFPIVIERNPDGRITVKDKFAVNPKQRIMVGKKVVSFPDGFQFMSQKRLPPEKVYEGVLNYPTGKSGRVRLSISNLDGYLVAKMQDLDDPIFIVSFTIGSVGRNGVIYLLSGRRMGTSWLQLRGVSFGEELEIYTVVGGVGISKEKSILHSVEQ